MSTIKANTLLHSDGSQTTEPSIPALDQRMAKAWINFNGTGTIAIVDSYNVSSITDIDVGINEINFTTAMPDTKYTWLGTCMTYSNWYSVIMGFSDAKSTSTLRVATADSYGSGGWADLTSIAVVVYSS